MCLILPPPSISANIVTDWLLLTHLKKISEIIIKQITEQVDYYNFDLEQFIGG